MSKSASIKALEKVWIAETEGRLPFQSRAAIYRRLECHGLVRFDGETISGGSLPVRVEGWYLTHSGRLLYCSTC
jgi:hypothetical protein